MNKKAIIATAKTAYSKEDECYITQSPLWDLTCGAGDTPEEAFNTFIVLFEEEYEDYINGNHIASPRKAGRPAKGKTRLHAEIDPDIKEAITALGKTFHMSQGEVIEYLYKIRES